MRERRVGTREGEDGSKREKEILIKIEMRRKCKRERRNDIGTNVHEG